MSAREPLPLFGSSVLGSAIRKINYMYDNDNFIKTENFISTNQFFFFFNFYGSIFQEGEGEYLL